MTINPVPPAMSLVLFTSQNSAVPITTSSTLAGIFFIFFCLLYIDFLERRKDSWKLEGRRSEKYRAEKTKSFHLNEILDDIFPIEFTNASWFVRFSERLYKDHAFACIFSAHQSRESYLQKEYRSLAWLSTIGTVVNVFVMDTAIQVFVLPDNGTCENIHSEGLCLQMSQFTRHLCTWNAGLLSCNYNRALLTSTIDIFFEVVAVSLIVVIVDYAIRIMLKRIGDIFPIQPELEQSEHDDGIIIELKSYQSFRTTILRAARLSKLSKWDILPIGMEAVLLRNVHEQRRSMQSYTWSEKVVLRVKDQFHGLFDGFVNINRQIIESRFHARKIAKAASCLCRNIDKEKYLLQQFFTHCYSSYRRRLCEQFWSVPTKRAHVSTGGQHLWLTYGCMFGVITYFSGAVFVIYRFGRVSGTAGAEAWFTVLVASLVVHFCILQPFKAFFVGVVLAGSFRRDMQSLKQLLISRSKLIMLRTSGLVRCAHSATQHLHPACRAAKKHPSLSVARLLLSFNDFDFVPLSGSEEKEHGRNRNLSGHLILIATAAVSYLPEIFQDVIFEIVSVVFVGLVLMGFILASLHPELGIPVACATIGAALIYGCFAHVIAIGVEKIPRDEELDSTVGTKLASKPSPSYSKQWSDALRIPRRRKLQVELHNSTADADGSPRSPSAHSHTRTTGRASASTRHQKETDFSDTEDEVIPRSMLEDVDSILLQGFRGLDSNSMIVTGSAVDETDDNAHVHWIRKLKPTTQLIPYRRQFRTTQNNVVLPLSSLLREEMKEEKIAQSENDILMYDKIAGGSEAPRNDLAEEKVTSVTLKPPLQKHSTGILSSLISQFPLRSKSNSKISGLVAVTQSEPEEAQPPSKAPPSLVVPRIIRETVLCASTEHHHASLGVVRQHPSRSPATQTTMSVMALKRKETRRRTAAKYDELDDWDKQILGSLRNPPPSSPTSRGSSSPTGDLPSSPDVVAISVIDLDLAALGADNTDRHPPSPSRLVSVRKGHQYAIDVNHSRTLCDSQVEIEGQKSTAHSSIQIEVQANSAKVFDGRDIILSPLPNRAAKKRKSKVPSTSAHQHVLDQSMPAASLQDPTSAIQRSSRRNEVGSLAISPLRHLGNDFMVPAELQQATRLLSARADNDMAPTVSQAYDLFSFTDQAGDGDSHITSRSALAAHQSPISINEVYLDTQAPSQQGIVDMVPTVALAHDLFSFTDGAHVGVAVDSDSEVADVLSSPCPKNKFERPGHERQLRRHQAQTFQAASRGRALLPPLSINIAK